MSNGKFLKFTFHGGPKKSNDYLNMPSPIFNILKTEIEMCLFEKRSLPRCELRVYWIDVDGDEIDIINQNDYEIFNMQRSERKHLQVAPIGEKVGDDTNKSNNNSASTDVNPSAFVVHNGVTCDSCNQSPIVGFRYKCFQCPDYDLCERCESQHKHIEHLMVRVPDTTHSLRFVDAWFNTGGSRRSKHTKGFCPFAAAAQQNTTSAGCTEDQQQQNHQHHRRRRHEHKKQHEGKVRSSIFTHMYDIMQDLAEGGTSANRNHSSAASGGDSTATNIGHVAAQAAHVANAAAAAAAAAINSEELHKAAHQAATLAAQNISNATFGFTADAASSTPQAANNEKADELNNKEVEKNKATNATPPSTPDTTQTSANQSNDFSGISVSPSLENIAQMIDPQYMKAGIQILNNFSEMFAKMLDPADDIGTSGSFSSTGNYKRKNSTSSTASTNTTTSSFTKSTNTENTEKEAPKTVNVSVETVPAPVSATVSTTTVGPIVMEEAERRRSTSVDNDWQMIDNSSSMTTMGSNISSATINHDINFKQLSDDLKLHVEQENAKKPKEVKQPENDTTATTAPATNVANTSAAADENSAIDQSRIIYHADPRINNAVLAMMAMGFSNEGACLTQLLESVNGNIPAALDLMSSAQRGNFI